MEKDLYDAVTTHTLKHKDDSFVQLPGQQTKVFTLNNTSSKDYQTDDDDDDDDISFPTKSGYLEKMSGGKKRNPKWDRRFFELTTAGYLHYSKKQDEKLSGSIYLRGSPVRIDSSDACVITIEHEQREWKLRGDNDLEIFDWYNAIVYYALMDEIVA